MQLFLNKKEVPALIRAVELLLSEGTHSSEAEKLLSRIYDCLEKQDNSKTKG